MLLTFSVLYDKLLSGEKLQTTRLNWRRWWDWAIHNWKKMLKLQMYWHNPRNGGKKMGEAKCTSLVVKHVCALTEEDAKLDGFDTLEEYLAELERLNGGKLESLDRVALIKFAWLDGPVDVRGGEEG